MSEITYYDIIYSLGGNCACAHYLDKLKLRATSGPFDWLCSGDLGTRRDIICNDFQHFCDKQYFSFFGHRAPCDMDDEYVHTLYGLHFLHDFAKELDFDSVFPQVAAKYRRRAERFKKHLADDSRMLLVWMNTEGIDPDGLILQVHEDLRRHIHKDFDLLVLNHKENCVFEERKPAPHITVRYTHIAATDEKGNAVWYGNEQHCIPLFQGYALKKVRKARALQAWYVLLSRILCCFVPRHTWRKQIRRHFEDRF